MGKGIVNELAVRKKNGKDGNRMVEEDTNRFDDDDRGFGDSNQMVIEGGQKKSLISGKIIKKKRLTHAQKKNEELANFRVRQSAQSEMKKKEIKTRLQNKKNVKLDHTLLKTYQEKFETESRKVLKEKVHAAGKRKRLKKRTHYIKKQLFNKYIEQVQTGKDSTNLSFEMDGFSKELKFIEFDLEKEKEKFKKKKIDGISSSKAESTAIKEVNHVSKVMQHPSFRKDPLETIRSHLTNTYNSK